MGNSILNLAILPSVLRVKEPFLGLRSVLSLSLPYKSYFYSYVYTVISIFVSVCKSRAILAESNIFLQENQADYKNLFF